MRGLSLQSSFLTLTQIRTHTYGVNCIIIGTFPLLAILIATADLLHFHFSRFHVASRRRLALFSLSCKYSSRRLLCALYSHSTTILMSFASALRLSARRSCVYLFIFHSSQFWMCLRLLFFLLHFPCIFRPLLLLLCRNDMRGRRRVSCIHATNEQKRDEKPTRSRAPLSREGRYFFVFFSMPSLLLRFVRTTAYR